MNIGHGVRTFWLLALVPSVSGLAFAQTTIRGRVTDPDEKAVVGAAGQARTSKRLGSRGNAKR